MTTATYQQALDRVIAGVIQPRATEIDRTAVFPSEALTALAGEGLLGLVSRREDGGLGLGHRAAAGVTGQIAESCASTAMVVCMHYAAAAVIDAHGPEQVRRAIVSGGALATLAFSESGSRSHFWAPVSTAQRANGSVRVDAQKSMVTSAGHADFYVWSSRPLSASGASTLWLVPGNLPGLRIAGAFDGMGLRGNSSAPIIGENVRIPEAYRLGADGAGFDIMTATVLPYFQVMASAISAGIMSATIRQTAAHVTGTRFEYLGQSLADLPTVRANLARMRLQADAARTLLDDTLNAIEDGRPDALLRILEVKAATAEAATAVTDLALRVCGGAAYRKETGIDRYFRDARASTLMAPTTDVLYELIGRLECGLPLFS